MLFDNMSDMEKQLIENTAAKQKITVEEAAKSLGIQYTATAEVDEIDTPADEDTVLFTETKTESATKISEEDGKEKEIKSEDTTTPTMVTRCVQCGWDQSVEPIEEPTKKEKLEFLHVLLGLKLYSKTYSMYGGRLEATFRMLSTREIDAIYASAYEARLDGRLQNAEDYYEYLNRLRLNLQLIKLESYESDLHITLPDGLTSKTNTDAKSYWDQFLADKGEKGLENNEKLQTSIQDYISTAVLKTENIQRLVAHECSKFNRLVVRLEACVDSPDFLEEIEKPI